MNVNQTPMLPQPKNKTWLWIVLIIIAVVALLVAVYYFYYGYTVLPEGIVQEQGVDEVVSLENDLGSIGVEGLDADLGSIDKELVQ